MNVVYLLNTYCCIYNTYRLKNAALTFFEFVYVLSVLKLSDVIMNHVDDKAPHKTYTLIKSTGF